MNPGETELEAAIRETEEETGIHEAEYEIVKAFQHVFQVGYRGLYQLAPSH